VNFGNAEIDTALLVELPKYFNVEANEDEGELYIQADKDNYTTYEVTRIAYIIGNLKPDECELMEHGKIRLWWD
jgi:hypothetical protein